MDPTLPVQPEEDKIVMGPGAAPAEPEEKITFGPGKDNVVLPEDLAKRRAFKAQFGTPGAKPIDELYKEFLAGREGDNRNESAAFVDNQKNIKTQEALQKFSTELKRPLEDKDIKFVSGLVQSMSNKTDPASVYEEYYGKAYMDQLEFNKLTYGDNAFDDAAVYDPDFAKNVKSAGAGLTAKREFALTMKENSQGIYNQQSIPGWVADRLKDFFFVYPEVKLRGNVPGVGVLEGGLLGENLEAQARKLLSLPFDEYKPVLQGIMNKLNADNPGVANQFMDAVLGQSQDEKFVNNMLSVFNIVGAADAGALVKGVFTKAAPGKIVTRDFMTGAKISEEAIIAKTAEDVAKEASANAASKKAADAAAKAATTNDPIDIAAATKAAEEATVAKAKAAEPTIKEAVKQMVKTAADPKVERPDITAATGNFEGAAVQRVARDLSSAPGSTNPSKQLIEDLPTYMKINADKIMDNVGNGGQDLANRIRQGILEFKDRFIKEVQDVIKVERIPEALANEKVLAKYKDFIRNRNINVDNAIMDISDFKPNKLTTGYYTDVIIGQPMGGLFSSRQIANTYAGNKGLQAFPVEQKGNGFFIRYSIPVDETNPIIREAFNKGETSAPAKGWINSIRAWLQTPEETMSIEHRANRLAATTGQSVLSNLMKEKAIEIDKVKRGIMKTDPVTGDPIILASRKVLGGRKQRWDEWQRAVNFGQHAMDPETSQKGYFFKTIGELEDHYLRNFNRLPDEIETRGYFAVTDIIESDAMMRDILSIRNKERLGVQQHRFYTRDAEGKKVASAYFEGARRDTLPGGDGTIMLVEDRYGKERLTNAASMGKVERDKITKDVKEGRKVAIEIYDPERTPFNGYGKVKAERVQYIIADAMDVKGLDYNQIGRRGGGHIEYEYDWYIKQAKIAIEKIGRSTYAWYNGDTTIMAAAIRAMGKDGAERLDTVRRMLLAKDEKGAKAYAAQYLDIEWKEMRNWFRAHKIDGVDIPARLNLETPIMVVPRGKKIIDLGDALQRHVEADPKKQLKFRDGTTQNSMARQNQIEYTQERDSYDMFALDNKGTPQNPLYTRIDAKTMDVIPMMDRALERITNSFFMDDYKTYAMEHWLVDAKPFLVDPDRVKYSPAHFFNKPDYVKGIPPAELSRLEAARMQIKQLIGTPSKVDTVLHSAAQNLSDAIYNKYGKRAAELAPTWMISSISDIPTYMRMAAFHAKLGVFNPAQILVQVQTFANITALAGHQNAAAGTYAAFLTQLSRTTSKQNILNHLDDMATKLNMPGVIKGWKTGEFQESLNLLNRSGFGNVGGEYAALDYMKGPSISSTKFGRFLDYGTFFFKEGERMTRYGAWHTAYREFRDANPTLKVGNKELQNILSRADILTANMTRASNSSLHRGVFSIPTQFLAYQLRVAELFLGNRLTMADRGRMLAWYSGLYGVPLSVGLTGIPAGDSFRTAALENGYVVGEDWYSTAFMEGIPSLMLQMVTGNTYNFGDRYGTGGMEWAKEALNSDNPWWKTVGGASWSVLSNTWERTDGFMAAMGSLIRNDQQAFPVKAADIVDVFKEVSSVNSAWRAYMAINTGKFLSKKEMYLDDVSGMEAVLMGVTGLQHQKASDIHLMSMSLKDQNDANKHLADQAIKEMRRGLRNAKDNPEASKQHFIRANTYLTVGNFPADKRSSVIAKAMKDYEPLTSSIYFDFYIKNAPDAEKQDRAATFARQINTEKTIRGQQ